MTITADHRSVFEELRPPMNESEAVLEADRCLECGGPYAPAPCVTACPANVDVPAFVGALARGDTEAAAATIFAENLLGGTCARVCPVETLCEAACLLAHEGRRPLEIARLQRFATDSALFADRPLRRARPRNWYSVAVIGAGPAGLVCAGELAARGFDVTVYDERVEGGGLARFAIAPYRLQQEPLPEELRALTHLGVKFELGVAIDTRDALAYIESFNDAVVLAVGMGADADVTYPGDSLPGVWNSLAFIEAIKNGAPPAVGESVVVIGGGNTAIDCARTALRLGADVTVAYRRTRAEMPAIADEVADAEREGVRFVFLAAPTRVLPGEGTATVVFKRMRLSERGADGRATVVESSEPAFPLQADTILTAIGEDVEAAMLPPELRDAGNRRSDEWGCTRVSNVFVGGDLAGEDRTVATALGHGKRAAIGIDRYLRTCRGEHFTEELIDELSVGGVGTLSMTRWRQDDPIKRVAPQNDVVEFEDINTASFERMRRHEDKHFRHAADFAESNTGLRQDDALREAGRCFQCGICNECELCLIYCGDVAIVRSTSSTARFDVRMDYCKGCGVCAQECPRGAIVMTREGL